MPRPEKVQAVAYIKERIEGAQAVFLAEFAGLSVKDQQALRRELRANGAEFKVVKMSLARRAVDELEIESLDELLLGPTALAFADGDPVGAAKVLKEFAKGHDVFTVKGGLLGIEFLTPEKIAELADIEPRDVLLSKLAGALKAPMSNLAGLFAALPRNTASVLAQLLEKKESAQEEPTAEQQPVADSSQPTAQEEPAADSQQPTAEQEAEVDGEGLTAEDQSTADSSQPTAEQEAAADADATAEAADESSETEGETVVTVEASDDAGEETENQTDEASKDDAEEE